MVINLPKPREVVTEAGIFLLFLGGIFTAIAFIVLFVSLAGNDVPVGRALIMLAVSVATCVIGIVTVWLASKGRGRL